MKIFDYLVAIGSIGLAVAFAMLLTVGLVACDSDTPAAPEQVKEITQEEIAKAKQLLRQAGYFVLAEWPCGDREKEDDEPQPVVCDQVCADAEDHPQCMECCAQTGEVCRESEEER